jgi:hypothetical protein
VTDQDGASPADYSGVPASVTFDSGANSPATGGPGIIGSLLAGETLTATTENIEDEDGLTGAVFAYQWLRSDTDIEGEISSTYTMTDDDEGKAIQGAQDLHLQRHPGRRGRRRGEREARLRDAAPQGERGDGERVHREYR